MSDFNPTDHMMDLKGKNYLPVAARIIWFRRDYPQGTIETSIVSIDEKEGSAIYRARITTGAGGVAEGTGDETRKDFPAGWIGKAETKAIGRALGFLGYGTMAAFEDEPANPIIADAPVDRPRSAPANRPTPAPTSAGPLGIVGDHRRTRQARLDAAHNYLDEAQSVAEVETRAANIRQHLTGADLDILVSEHRDRHTIIHPAPTSAPAASGDPANQRATERQVKFIFAVAREAGLDEQELTTWSQELYGNEVSMLNRRDASTLIEALQRRRNEVA